MTLIVSILWNLTLEILVPSESPPRVASYRVYGMSQSYFTRKLTGYLDYKAIPYLMRRFVGGNHAARQAGWPGAMPLVMTPAGDFMWDTTAMIHHLESRFPEPSVFPADPVLRFIETSSKTRSTNGFIVPPLDRDGSTRKTIASVDGSLRGTLLMR
jgi:glutathione S-transferase